MRVLKDILYNVALQSVQGTTDVCINSIQYDSRIVDKNDVFIAIKGILDGYLFIEKAIENGASVIVAEFLPENKLKILLTLKLNLRLWFSLYGC